MQHCSESKCYVCSWGRNMHRRELKLLPWMQLRGNLAMATAVGEAGVDQGLARVCWRCLGLRGIWHAGRHVGTVGSASTEPPSNKQADAVQHVLQSTCPGSIFTYQYHQSQIVLVLLCASWTLIDIYWQVLEWSHSLCEMPKWKRMKSFFVCFYMYCHGSLLSRSQRNVCSTFA